MSSSPPVAAAATPGSPSALSSPTSSPQATTTAANSAACSCCCDASRWLKACIVGQLLITVLRLLTPRPLLAAGNVFLVFLGWGSGSQRSLVRLFFLAFFSLVLGVSDAFWLVVKCTGPYGMAWLDPKFYWKPYVVGHHPFSGLSGDAQPAADARLANSLRDRMLPPEHPPAVFQIYVELVTFCISPVVCLLGAWLAWKIYKQRLPSVLHENDLMFPPFAVPTEDTPLLQQQQLLQHQLQHQQTLVVGPECTFVPFGGEGRCLGNSEDADPADKP
ncbi:hypothetical protein Efla_000344 [Eimeria flavescens]